MHDYTPYSDEDLDDLMPDGQYQAEIMEYIYLDDYGQPLRTAKGVPAVKVLLNVMAPDRPRTIMDYIQLNKQWAWKYKHLCDSIGRVQEYMSKTLQPQLFPGAITWIEVGNQPAQGGYRAKNIVNDYIKKADQPQAPQAAQPSTSVQEFFNDDVPF